MRWEGAGTCAAVTGGLAVLGNQVDNCHESTLLKHNPSTIDCTLGHLRTGEGDPHIL
jgi:hypothetical protein